MSVNYYCKVVSKDTKEIIANVRMWCSVRDSMQVEFGYSELERLDDGKLKALPNYILTKDEIKNNSFLGRADAETFIFGKISNLESKIGENKTKLESEKLKLLLAKTDVAYRKIQSEIDFLESCIECDEETLAGYEALKHDVYYELDNRIFYKNNKPVYREKEYKYHDIKDYDLYFFWS